MSFIPKWVSLGSIAKDAPLESGVYALGLPAFLHYPNGKSRIVYIGSSGKIRNRLKRHNAQPHNDVIDKLIKLYGSNLFGAFWPFPNLPKDWLRSIESEAIWAFENQFGVVPIGNNDIPESHLGAGYRGIAKIVDDNGSNIESLGLDVLAKRMNCELEIAERTPIGNPDIGVEIAFSVDPNGELYRDGLYRAASFLPAGTAKKRAEGEIFELCRIDPDHVYSWTTAKMKGIIEVCRSLHERKARAKKFKEFDAKCRDVPTPHTWGEVALVLGRIVNGAWYVEHGKRSLSIVIKCGDETLGSAGIFSRWFGGWDESDRPQRKTARVSSWEIESSRLEPKLSKSDYVSNVIEYIDEKSGEEWVKYSHEVKPDVWEHYLIQKQEHDDKMQKLKEDKIEEMFISALGQ